MARFEQNNDPNKADASPTKAFFVDIITKDILLDEAIQDLIDNCVDGAKRMRPGPNPSYAGLWVKIHVGADYFEISDNCGGIPLDIAQHYAFKFGRAAGFKSTTGSVGQFGIGMKRALFKMGECFSIETVEPHASYKIDVDVPDWVDDNVNWDFDIDDLITGPNDQDDLRTTLKVTKFAEGVADAFDDGFIESLRQDIRSKQQPPMRIGLQIFLNETAIIPTEWQMKEGDGIAPAFRSYQDDLGGEALLHTRLFAGVGESSRAHAGWYIFCNGRCILEADQDRVTGWSQVSDGVNVPKYHGQFARFRGYAFLDSEDASILPWNTTKTGLDLESSAYRLLLHRLIEITRPVIDFLNLLDGEKDMEPADRTLTRALDAARTVALEKIPERPTFVYTPPPRRGPPMTSISYKKPKAEADQLKEALNASNNKELGELSFDVAFDALVED